MKHSRILVVATGLLLMGAAAQAQSLADVARQEKERRSEIKEPARLYTIADVQNAPLLTMASEHASVSDPAKEGASTAVAIDEKAGGPAAVGAKDTPAPTDEAAWRDKVTQAREEVARSRRLLSAMEQQLAGLAMLAAQAAVMGQPVPDSSRQQESAKEVERLRADVEKNTAALSRLAEEARAAGIPPGWVR